MSCGPDWTRQVGKSVVVLYADCEVYYEGRASSTASRAWRLVILKPDGTILIHTDESYQPMNWQPPGSRITVTTTNGKTTILAVRHRPREVIKVIIHDIEWACWGRPSEGLFRLNGTHDDLKNRIARNITRYIPGGKVIGVEYEIPGHGIADIVAIDGEGRKWVIEVKRQCADLQAVSQLKRYVDALGASGMLVAPCFTSGARELALKYGFRLVEEEP